MQGKFQLNLAQSLVKALLDVIKFVQMKGQALFKWYM